MTSEARVAQQEEGIQQVVEGVARGVFPIRMDVGDGLHLAVLDRVTAFLEGLGYGVCSEYPVTHAHYCLRQDWTSRRAGRMDLVAYGHGHTIAVEFDTGGVIKARTAEKLVDSDTDYSIGISYGGVFRPSLGFATRDRFREALSHASRRGRPTRAWFIIVVRGIVEEVDLAAYDR